MTNFLITTTPTFEGRQIKAYLGVLNTNIVIGTNLFSDFAASFTDVFGGSSGTYQRKMDMMYDNAQNELVKKAKRIGANAIVGFRIDFDEISGKGKSMFMISATGTACVIEDLKQIDNKINNSVVDSVKLKEEIQKEDVVSKICSSAEYFTAEEDWNYLTEHPSKELVDLLLKYRYIQLFGDNKRKVEFIISQIDFDDAVETIYPLFVDKYTPPSIIYGEEYNHTDQSKRFAPLIKNCKLFEPKRISELIDSNLEKGLMVLDCEKPYYNQDDLNYMTTICNKLDNLPDLGEKSVGKNGVFSKEKELYICRHGHKNDANAEYCDQCYENIKGLTKEEVAKIEAFKKRTQTLEKLLSGH
jgi:uncharacterized protein YbjQ (UPF0145 family)